MTTLEKIMADIKNQLFVGRLLNSKDFDDGLKWCLELIDKYAEQDPCDDAISRQAVLDNIKNGFHWESVNGITAETVLKQVIHDVEIMPSVQQEPKSGHWIYTEYHTWCCSECGGNPHKWTGFVPNKDGMKMRWKYCNLCGAKMVEPQETETWHGIHAQITAPKGTFERIFNEADDDYDI